MGITPDLIGQQFNYLTVLSKTEKRDKGAVVWLCQCKCGKLKEVTTANLRGNRVMSCGCYNKEVVSQNYNNLLGLKFGRLTVLEKTDKRSDKRCIIWKCKCDCGNFCEITSEALTRKQNPTKSCGCLQREKAAEIGHQTGLDITGKKFGKLTPICLVPESQERTWKCLCDCGNTCYATSQNLLRGHKKSCGCLKSEGELKIAQLLKQANIDFIEQYHTDNCRFPDTHYHAFFDFYVNNSYIIEFDGEQHFNPQKFNGINDDLSNKNFIKTQLHDQYKNQWCQDNNIAIIRIPYTHLNELCLDDLLLETSKFVLKG